ncbi:MAG: glycosyltransferase family 4 protein [Chitinispirillia bacterium]|jgi:glycosyltransferase involved in cell wall biosynthesis
MRIWFAADIDMNIPGGVARSMLELADGLGDRGHHVKFVTKNTLPNSNYLMFSIKLSILFLRTIYDRPDWIIARSTDSLFCLILIKIFNIKTQVILHNHGWEESVYNLEKKMSRLVISNKTTWKGRFIRFPLLRLTLRLCTKCLNVNNHEKQFLKEKYPCTVNKLLTVPNGVHCRQGIYWQSHPPPPYNFLCVGNMTWKKNLNHTLRLFACLKRKLTNSKLFIIGTGIDDISLFQNNNLEKNDIMNVPLVSYEEMDKWYTACPYLIVSSRFEGCSLTILEALSYGIIVFATGIGSNREIIEDGFNGYLITGSNIKSDSDTIVNLLNKKNDLITIRRRAVETARYFSWSKQVLKLEKILCKE